MKISVFEHGYTNLISNKVIEDWNELVDVLIDVKPGKKNGTYITRGFCDGPRADENIQGMDLIIIDGDSLLDNGSSCCHPDGVHNLLKEKNITHCIHSSYSQDLANNILKWRAIIPCNDLVDAGALKQGVGEVISLFHEHGFMIRNVRENVAESQPWFLPRCPEGLEDDFFSAYHDGTPWELHGIPVTSSAKIAFITETGKNNGAGGHFSWDWALEQFRSGTLHQGIKSICGWLIHTTDWADSQIKSYLITQISLLCPNQEKVKRARETKEIDNLIKYCREKHGVIERAANWKDNILSADELQSKEFPPIKWAVDGVIPEGLTILAGDPKAGKSLMAVDVCSAIASGVEAFGNRSCVKGTCVYISLEDPPRRVKARIQQQCDLWPETFKLVSGGIPQLGPSFYDVFDEMLIMWPSLRAIIIDTMAFIIPSKPHGTSDYDHYYKHMDPLHRWSIENQIAVVLITHLTKSKGQEGDNPFSRIIGSVAIQGTSDAMILLRKNHAKRSILNPELPDGFLTIEGRELGSDNLALDFDTEALKWSIIREAEVADETINPNWILISGVLKGEKKGPTEITRETKLNQSTVKSCLRRMKAANLVESEGGKYHLVGDNLPKENDWW